MTSQRGCDPQGETCCPRAIWPVRLAENASSRLIRRPKLIKFGGNWLRKMLLSALDLHEYTHVCTRVPTYMYNPHMWMCIYYKHTSIQSKLHIGLCRWAGCILYEFLNKNESKVKPMSMIPLYFILMLFSSLSSTLFLFSVFHKPYVEFIDIFKEAAFSFIDLLLIFLFYS